MAPATPSATTETRWLNPDEQAAWRSFITGARRLTERLGQELKAMGLGHDDYGVLVALSESPDDRMRMAELADHSVESRSRLSHHIGRLEAKGFVERQTCPEDRRGTWAVLTPAGRTMIEAVAPHHVEGVRRHLLDHVSTEELEVLRRVFDRVNDALGPGAPCLGVCPDLSGPPADA